MDAVTFLYATAQNEKIAEEISRQLVENGDAACVNMIPAVKSFYCWEGRIETTAEVVLIVKTMTSLSDRARATILAAHPYENPAVAAMMIDEAHSFAAFCNWIRKPD